MSFHLSTRSLSKLEGVHPDLVAVVKRCIKITKIDFTVLEGLRTMERQKMLYTTGASTTLNSRHLTSHAVDIAPYIFGEVSWHWNHHHRLAEWMKAAAEDMEADIAWGGDWKGFPDGCHYELSWGAYPAERVEA